MDFPDLEARLASIRAIVADRQRQSGQSHAVRVVAVTKSHGADAVRAAARAGIGDVGENRVHEALQKRESCAGLPMRWHLIGGLQRNKARHAAGAFALIQSVDRLELAEELQRRGAEGARQAILVQVNCSGEPQKGGVELDAVSQLLDAIRELSRLELRGLMTMAAYDADEPRQRRTFALLRSVRDRQEQRGYSLPELSMGMSGDFAAAVEEGATMLRLGTALFGSRDTATPSPAESRS